MSGNKELSLGQMLEAVWSAEPYKLILSNPANGRAQYRRIVLNRLEKCWQAEKYTQKQVFHENLTEESAKGLTAENLGPVFRQLNAWDGEAEHTVRVSKSGSGPRRLRRRRLSIIGRKTICWRRGR